jgi:hypothetical protein
VLVVLGVVEQRHAASAAGGGGASLCSRATKPDGVVVIGDLSTYDNPGEFVAALAPHPRPRPSRRTTLSRPRSPRSSKRPWSGAASIGPGRPTPVIPPPSPPGCGWTAAMTCWSSSGRKSTARRRGRGSQQLQVAVAAQSRTPRPRDPPGDGAADAKQACAGACLLSPGSAHSPRGRGLARSTFTPD